MPVVGNVPEVLETATHDGAVWRLADETRQLDANLVRLPPGEAVADNVEPDLDVLVHVVAGSGRLAGEPVGPGALVWWPRGTGRSVVAGADGLVYLTVHRRRGGLQIRAAASPD